jgi:hypothetical protein
VALELNTNIKHACRDPKMERALALALSNKQRLQRLSLRSNTLGWGDGSEILGDAVGKLAALRHLNIEGNHFWDPFFG